MAQSKKARRKQVQKEWERRRNDPDYMRMLSKQRRNAQPPLSQDKAVIDKITDILSKMDSPNWER